MFQMLHAFERRAAAPERGRRRQFFFDSLEEMEWLPRAVIPSGLLLRRYVVSPVQVH